MIRPQQLKQYSDIDLKLAIKSSFPKAKATLALLIMLWEASDRPSEISYSQAEGGKIVVSNDLKSRLIQKYSPVYSTSAVSDDSFIAIVNGNQLFKSQLEPLLVGIELVWRIARLRFADGRQQGAERTGGERFPKVLAYTCNIDVIDAVLSSDDDGYAKILLKWIGCNIEANSELENTLIRLLAYLAESSFYRLEDNGSEVIFNPNSLYLTLLASEGSPVDINGDVEAKGSLRTLKSALSEGLNPYLSYSNGGSVTISPLGSDSLQEYQSRVDNYLHINVGTLQGIKHLVVAPESESSDGASEVEDETSPFRRIDETTRKTGGANYLLYGVPGSGKSYTVKTEYCDDEERMERVVFHPDYTYSDFVGQIMPKLDEERRVYYDFSPGPFTRMLKKAYTTPNKEFFLVIEELNRGNAPAIFGEVFQLLDRKEKADEGYSWRLSKGRFNEFVADNRIWFGNKGENVPSIKRFLSEVKQGITPMTIWKYQEVGHSQKASQDLKRLFDDKSVFTYPKPVELVKRLLELYTNGNSIILDFFSGSATTAHAVMQLNAEDGGHRKFIMVQLQEPCDEKSEAFRAGYKNICEIGKERIRRAGEKIKEENKDKSGIEKLDTGFRVLKILNK